MAEQKKQASNIDERGNVLYLDQERLDRKEVGFPPYQNKSNGLGIYNWLLEHVIYMSRKRWPLALKLYHMFVRFSVWMKEGGWKAKVYKTGIMLEPNMKMHTGTVVLPVNLFRTDEYDVVHLHLKVDPREQGFRDYVIEDMDLEKGEVFTHTLTPINDTSANAAGGEVASRIVRAPMPALTPIPGSFATASMLSYVINAKYANAMPYYRLERDFSSIGAEISRQDMANWTINAHERWLSLIHARMKEKLLDCRYLNCDESEVQVLKEPGREPQQKSWMWLFRSGPHETPNCVFEYHPTRSGSVPRAFLGEGWEGYLTTDGYDPYFNLGIEGVTNTACLVHVRRRFAEIVKAAGGDAVCEGVDALALEARRRIDRIFRIDSKFDKMEPEARRKMREKKLRPHMESFREWAAWALGEAVPGLALHDALKYALKYWPYVMNVLKDGRLGLDNNISERCVKSFVIGRNYVPAKAMCWAA